MNRLIIFLISLLLFIFGRSLAQNKEAVHLLSPSFSSYISLTEKQKLVIDLLISEIKKIQEEDKSKFENIRKRRENGEQMDREEMVKLMEYREKNINIIKSDIEKIKSVLSQEQLKKFEYVNLPELRKLGRN